MVLSEKAIFSSFWRAFKESSSAPFLKLGFEVDKKNRKEEMKTHKGFPGL